MDEGLPLNDDLAGARGRASFLSRVLAQGTPMLWARWLFLRALGAIYFAVFYALAFQIHGLVGPRGILSAHDFLEQVASQMGPVKRVWLVPSLLWFGAGDGALTALVVAGIVASLLLVAGVWPRATIVACGVLFLSFIGVSQDFGMYQSDGMLLEASFASFFLAPRGFFPRLGGATPPTRAAVFLLRWEWFRIYFESGVVKIASGDPQWAHLTAMDHYYENGPLPTWIAWYAQQLPHSFHAFSCVLMFVVELGVVWLAWVGPRARLVCFAIVTPFQIGIILTANYAFLNYLVLALGVMLLDDATIARLSRGRLAVKECAVRAPAKWRVWTAAAIMAWLLYDTVFAFLGVPRDLPIALPLSAIETWRITNAYGLFAVMTEARYEIEFQGTTDGTTWVPYPFRYKPQDPMEAPGIYAPYQPRFDWNLWFASLGRWQGNEWVIDAEVRLIEGEPSVLRLFRADPFHGAKPLKVRTVEWRYWFTTRSERKQTGAWWNRELVGPYAPTVVRHDDGTIGLEPRSPRGP